MTYFKERELECFVSNNWLRRHGIPMKRKKNLYARKQMAKRLRTEAFFFGETEALFRLRDRIRYEKACITGTDRAFKEAYEEKERNTINFFTNIMRRARTYNEKMAAEQSFPCTQPPAVINQ